MFKLICFKFIFSKPDIKKKQKKKKCIALSINISLQIISNEKLTEYRFRFIFTTYIHLENTQFNNIMIVYTVHAA